jgi:BASS family bile acid:Na+ symporter
MNTGFSNWVLVLIPLSVFVIMICVGTSISVTDFKRLVLQPKATITGIVGQIIFLPVMGFIVAATVTDDLVTRIGIVLLSACPGGQLSNTFVYLARANPSLSVTLTAINGMLALITTPAIAILGIRFFAGEHTDIDLPVLKTIAQIFVLAILPVGIGMWIRKQFPVFSTRQRQSQANLIAFILLIFHMSLVIFTNFGQIQQSIEVMLLPAVLFALAAMSIGYVSASLMKLDHDTKFTIGIEVGLQNVVLAVLISQVLMRRPEFSLFVLTYAMVVPMCMLPWVYIHRRRWNLATLKQWLGMA